MDAIELEKAKETAKVNIKVLVDKCERVHANNELSKYIEERTRNEFIDDLFEALGWDVDNHHTDDEVVRQESVKIRGSTKKVDYAFKFGGVTKFFVEAKGLREDLEDIEFAKQAIGYGFNRSIRYAVLTNFSKLKVFNCEWSEPNIIKNLVFELNFKQYLSSDFDKLWLLSRESFKTNALDEYAKTIGKRTPSKEVADLLLEQMGIWRQKLSSDLSKRYGAKYPDYDIDEAVQRLLNRLIFMRHCEDRGIEEESLMAYLHQYEHTGKGLWAKVHRLFSDYDGWYDSSLFRAPALIDQMELDDKLVADVIKSLYYTPDGNRRYNFALIPADILGNMYEQYLSRRLRKTPERAKVKEDPDIRKGHGICYTPTYIVEYIVKNTLGEMLKGMKPADAAKIRVLDPACGSGSFLLKVFDTLEQYNQKISSDHAQSQLDATATNGRLTLQGRILRDNIFAVDLDPKAVEFAQLNLMLKAAETRAKLPMLDANIQNGNSLIDDASVAGEKYAFDWNTRFKEVMNSDGFDVVVGNPPYVQLSMDPELPPNVKSFLIETYKSSMGRLNTYGFFIKKGIDLLKENGKLGFIVPNTFLTQDYYEELRAMILDSCSIESIVNFSNLPFKDAVVENVVIVLTKTSSKSKRENNIIKIFDVNEQLTFVKTSSFSQADYSKNRKQVFTIFSDATSSKLKAKIDNGSHQLSEYLDINQAIALMHDRAKYLSSVQKDSTHKPVIDGRHIGRYSLAWDGQYLKYDVNAIHSCKREDIFLSKEKLFFRRVGARLIATYDSNQFYALNTLIVMNARPPNKNLKFLLGLFNSKLMTYYYRTFLKSSKTVFSEIQTRQIRSLPVKIDSQHEKEISASVDKMLSLNKRLLEFGDKQSSERQRLEKEIEETDKKIDELVYDLYGLTQEERKIIEESFNQKISASS